MGVFQADYPLERAAFLRAAPGQVTVPPGLTIAEPVGGWAACAVVGWDEARWIPLLNAYDRYGRLRGAAGAMLRHYRGPWRGSSWAFFGATNVNLFGSTQPGMADAFLRIIDSLIKDTYCASLTTEHGCYRQGETVRFSAPVFNGGRTTRTLRMTVAIFAGEPDDADIAEDGPEIERVEGSGGRGRSGGPLVRLSEPDVFSPVRSEREGGGEDGRVREGAGARKPVALFDMDLSVAPSQTNLVSGEWKPRAFESDFYHIVARLAEGTNGLDRIESGFVARDDRTIAAGPRLEYRDNYLRFGSRPLFQFGTDDWSYVFNTARETPLQWLEDMRLRRDLGVTIYENLQFGLPRSAAVEERLLRQVDGVVQLAQKYGQVYFAGLLIGYNAAASDAELALQRDYAARFARRYRDVPGLIYYLNGDYRCELSDAVTPHWNEFLSARYGSTAVLRDAWGPQAPVEPLGSIPSADYHDWEQTWEDVSAYDRNAFRAWLLRRWNTELIAGIRAHDTRHPTSGEFYQLPHGGVDLPAGIDGLDLSNFGFFETPRAGSSRFAALCKLNDQRARGKSGGPGEYGVKTHPAWGDGRDYGYHTARTREAAMELFLTVAHDSLGLGASRVHNWCWKDDAHRVFPWGMVYPCDGVPKDTAYLHRNLSLLFRHFAPVYQEPEVYVLTPDCHRLGGAKWKVTEGILVSLDLALATHVHNLGTLNEQDRAIPASARVLFYPIPYCLADETYEKLRHWVEEGGVLYVSGDFSYDELRRCTRPERLAELAGVRRTATLDAPLAVRPTEPCDQPAVGVEALGATVLRRTAEGAVLLVENRVGRGRVFFTSDPIELHSTPERRAADIDLYRRVLAGADVPTLGVRPDRSDLHVFRVPLRDGGQVWIVANRDETQPRRAVTLTETPGPVTLEVARRRFGLLWYDGSGALRAVEAQGDCHADGKRMLSDETDGVVLALDGESIERSQAILLMPLRAGRTVWSSSARWDDPRVESGEFRTGRWRIGETQPAVAREGQVEIQVGADQVLSLLLVCDDEALPRWRRALERALTTPDSLP